MNTIYFWTDGTWCHKEEYSIAGYSWKSDDIGVIEIEENICDAEIDNIVRSKITI